MAQQKSNKPTNKVISAVVAAPVIQYLLPLIGMSGEPMIESGIMSLGIGIVSYLVPPSLTDQVEENLPKE